MRSSHLTLVEVVVVVVICVWVGMIVVPTTKFASQNSRDLVCKRNLQILAMSWHLYAQDSDGKLVYGGTPTRINNEWFMTNGASPWVVLPDDPYRSTLEEKIEHLKLGALWPYVHSVDVYHCPDDIRDSNEVFHNPAWRSYSIPQGLNAGSSLSWQIKTYHQTFDSIKDPAEKISFLPDSDVRGFSLGGWVMSPVSGTWIDQVAMWHTGHSTNMAYVDGHVSERFWQSQGFIDWCNVALYEPDQFSFRRTPDSNEEYQDFNFMLDAYPYGELTGDPHYYPETEE